MMKAVVKNNNSAQFQNVEKAKINSKTDVLIAVKYAGFCRTDSFAAQGIIDCKEGTILGHEFSGVVEEIGSAVNGIKIGDRVTVMPIIPCKSCSICDDGHEDQCQNTTMLGIDHNGAFADYVVVPESTVFKIPDSLSFQCGAYSEPVAAALSVMKAGIKAEEKGFIYGDNRFSQLINRILGAYGINNVEIYDPNSTQVLKENSYDFAIETLATNEAMQTIFKALKPRGKVVLKSRKYEPVGISFNSAVRKELTLQAVNYGDFAEAISLMADKRIKIDDLLGEQYPLEECSKVFNRKDNFEKNKMFFKIGR